MRILLTTFEDGGGVHWRSSQETHPDYFQHEFWQKQLQCAHKKDRRWHPLMIKWVLYIRHFSGKAYDTMRESGFIALASQRTLLDYTYFVSSSGFSADVDKQLMEVNPWRSTSCLHNGCNACHVLSKCFINLGNVNDLLILHEHSLATIPPHLWWNQCLYLYCLFTNFQFLYAQFACRYFLGDIMFSLFLESCISVHVNHCTSYRQEH